jgi:hypothetical protein
VTRCCRLTPHQGLTCQWRVGQWLCALTVCMSSAGRYVDTMARCCRRSTVILQPWHGCHHRFSRGRTPSVWTQV